MKDKKKTQTIKTKFDDIVEMENNSPPTDKVLNWLSFWIGFACFLMMAGFLGFAFAQYTMDGFLSYLAEQIWFCLVFVVLAAAVVSLCFGIGQTIRQRYLSSLFGIVFSAVSLSLIIFFIVWGYLALYVLYIPFAFFPF